MTSTTLRSDSGFSPAFSKAVKKSLGNMIGLCIIAFIVPLFATAVTFFNNAANVKTTDTHDITIGALVVLGIMTLAGYIFSLFISPRLFKEIYKKQSCDLYFSLPIKREAYFTSSYLYGAIVLLVTTTIPSFLYSVLTIALSTKYVTFTVEWGVLILTVLHVTVCLLAIYSSFIMCAVIAGRGIHYILLALICINASSVAISGVLSWFNSIWGYFVKTTAPLYIDPYNNIINSVLISAFPDGEFLANGLTRTGTHIVLFAFAIIEIIGMFIAGLLVFKKRRSEVAENTISGKVLPYILLAVLCLAGFVRYGQSHPVVAMLAGCVVAVLFAMAFCGVFYKKAFTKKTAITVASICLSGILVLSVINFPSHSRYVKYIPEASEIESIELSTGESTSIDLDLLSTFFDTGLINSVTGYDFSDDSVKITGEKAIASTIKLHERLVEDEVISESKTYIGTALTELLFNFEDFFEGNDSYYDKTSISLTYTLKSGSTVSRIYSVNDKLVINQYYELVKNEELIDALPLLAPSSDDILSINVNNYSYAYLDDEEYDYDEENDEYLLAENEYEYNDKEVAEEDFVDVDISTDSWDKLKPSLKKDLLETKNRDVYLARFYELNNHRGIFDSSYWDAPNVTAVCDIEYWTISKDAPESIVKELKSMSHEELMAGYDNYFYSEEDFRYMAGNNNVDTSKVSKYAFIDRQTITIYDHQENTLATLKELGVNVK